MSKPPKYHRVSADVRRGQLVGLGNALRASTYLSVCAAQHGPWWRSDGLALFRWTMGPPRQPR